MSNGKRNQRKSKLMKENYDADSKGPILAGYDLRRW